MKNAIPILTLLTILLPLTVTAGECRDCHQSIAFNESNPRLFYYYNDFTNSVHGVARLACTDCHGGDPSTRDLDKSHVGAMDPVRFDTVTQTCGRCHADEHHGFTTSAHFRLLTEYRNAPNCVTCHGAMDVEVVNPGKIRAACAFCHNPESLTSPDVPERAEANLSRMASILNLKIDLEARATEGSRIWALAEDYLALAGRWHAFDLEAMDAATRRLKAAYRTAAKMLADNPDF